MVVTLPGLQHHSMEEPDPESGGQSASRQHGSDGGHHGGDVVSASPVHLFDRAGASGVRAGRGRVPDRELRPRPFRAQGGEPPARLLSQPQRQPTPHPPI